MRIALLSLTVALLLSACAQHRYRGSTDSHSQHPSHGIKDNRPDLWVEHHPRVTHFRNHYSGNTTVRTALERARRFMPYIIPEFQRRQLPIELAYLPMLESMFDPHADSGSAKGLWQFTPQTAEHMGLRVSRHRDERLDVHKATRAAAEYLDELGQRFNYNWALALAAYNGGPNYLSRAMRSQRTWNYWELQLRKEVAEYVPRFVAMVQVAKAKYPRMMVAARLPVATPLANNSPTTGMLPQPTTRGAPTAPLAADMAPTSPKQHKGHPAADS